MKQAILALALAAVSSPAFAQNMFRGDLAHTGFYKSDGPRQLKGVKWAFKTGGAVLSSPALSGGVAYIGSDDQNLYAVDTATGREKWKFATKGPVRSSPAVAGGIVYFGSYDGVFYAVGALTGTLKWKFEAPGERKFEAKGLHGYSPRTQTIPDFWDLYLSSPAVSGGMVYFGSGNGNFYALDAETGALKWKFAAQDVIHSSPALADGTVYFGSWDSYLYALDAQTGQEKWKFKTGEDKTNYNQVGIQSSPAVAGGIVYFGCREGHLYAVDARTGKQVWNVSTNGSWVNNSPAVHDGTVWFGTSIPTFLHAVDAKTGKPRFAPAEVKFIVFSSPALTASMAYFGTFDGKLRAVDAATGKVAWEFQTEAGKRNELGVIAKDGGFNPKAVFLSGFYEDMYASGAKLLSLGSILSSPVVDGGVLYVGSADGNLYAIE